MDSNTSPSAGKRSPVAGKVRCERFASEKISAANQGSQFDDGSVAKVISDRNWAMKTKAPQPLAFPRAAGTRTGLGYTAAGDPHHSETGCKDERSGRFGNRAT